MADHGQPGVIEPPASSDPNVMITLDVQLASDTQQPGAPASVSLHMEDEQGKPHQFDANLGELKRYIIIAIALKCVVRIEFNVQWKLS